MLADERGDFTAIPAVYPSPSPGPPDGDRHNSDHTRGFSDHVWGAPNAGISELDAANLLTDMSSSTTLKGSIPGVLCAPFSSSLCLELSVDASL